MRGVMGRKWCVVYRQSMVGGLHFVRFEMVRAQYARYPVSPGQTGNAYIALCSAAVAVRKSDLQSSFRPC